MSLLLDPAAGPAAACATLSVSRVWTMLKVSTTNKAVHTRDSAAIADRRLG